ncbi:MAG: M23 family metallopeptidase [Bacteroidales bacterium]|nr:M23 family metallopeptidase [Bacteroidales bacterium]
MSDGDYRFDPDSLGYEKEEQHKWRKLAIRIVTQVLATLTIGLVVFLTISYTIKTPRQNKIERENALMAQEYEVLSRKYEKVDSVLKDIEQRDKDIYRAIFETEMEPDNRLQRREMYTSIASDDSLKHLVAAMTEVSSKKLKEEEKTFNNLQQLISKDNDELQALPSILPVNHTGIDLIYYGFGKKLDPIYKMPKMHNGIDIAANIGTEIYATANGTIEFIGDKREHGKHIIINHQNGYKTLYAHLSEYMVRRGQKVKRGDLIGLVGNTGKTLTPHLHYEVQYNDKAVNPANYFFASLSPQQWNRVAKVAATRGLCLD